jgi:hypothetical protein
MARQAIDEAMNELPFDHKQVVRLAYFGGLTNREIAEELDLTVGGVRRRLRESLAILSAYVERGRAMGRRAVHLLIPPLWFRRPQAGALTHGPAVAQVVQAGMVAAAAVAAAALLATHPATPANAAHPHNAPPVTATGSAAHVQTPGKPGAPAVAPVPNPSGVAGSAPRVASVPSLPVNAQVPPPLPVHPPVHLPVHLPVHPPVHVPVHIRVHVPVHLPVHVPRPAPLLKAVLSVL